MLDMLTLNVATPSKHYPIMIGEQLDLPRCLAPYLSHQVAIVTNQTVAPLYKMFGVSQPLYKGIDSFVLGQSTLRKDTDDSIRLFFSLHNQSTASVAWPKLRVQLLGAGGKTTYEVITNVRDLAASGSAEDIAPHANLTLEAHVSAQDAKNAVTYKLEVVE